MESLRDLKKNIPIFWSNYNLDLRSYGQLLSLFLYCFKRIYILRFIYFVFVKILLYD